MLGARLPAARVARITSYRVRVFQAPPQERIQEMIRGIQARGELPPGARPKVLAAFDVKANTEAGAAKLVGDGLRTRGYTIRSVNRSTGNEFLAYVSDPTDLQSRPNAGV